MNNQQDEPDIIITRLDKTDPAQADKLFVLILATVCSGVVLLVKIITGN